MKRALMIGAFLIIIIGIFCFAKPVAKNNYTEWSGVRLNEKEGEYSVIVVGSDPEGITAAIASSRSGAKTLLLGKQDGPGGLLTYGMLNTLDMNSDGNGDLLTRGIFNEFYIKIGNTESFDVEKAKSVFQEMINAESNLTYLTNYKFVTPIMEENTIIGVTMEDKNGNKQDFYGKIIIDATQDGDVAAAAGADYYVGMEEVNLKDIMAATLVFKVDGVNWRKLGDDIRKYKNETKDTNVGINKSTAWAFGKWCYDKYQPLHSNMKLRGPNFGLQEDGTVLINALQIFDVDVFDEESVENAKKEGSIEAENIVKYLKGKLSSFENAELVGVADELYVRETRHIQGEYVLKATDLLDNINFYDKIALGSYPIDIQSNNKNNTGYVIGKPTVYSIPLRCLVPLKIENMFVVGKSASYSSVAAGSARVVPVGMVEGESAGIAAVYSIVNKVTPRELANSKSHMARLTNLLREQGVYLPEFDYPSNIPDVVGIGQIKKLINLGFISGGYNNNFRFEDEPKVSTFCVALINGLQRTGNEKYTIENIYNAKKYYTEKENLTGFMAGKVILGLFSKNIDNMSEEEIWELVKAEGYFDDMYEEIGKDQVLNKRQLYLLTVNTLEKFLGREIG